jgi:hypothetical protein
MRRLLDWFVVSLSLLVLLANRLWMQPAEQPAGPRLAAFSEQTPFAYVRADGTQVYLADPDGELPRPPLSFEEVHAASGFDTPTAGAREPKTAVYTWSSPVVAVTSGSTSSR